MADKVLAQKSQMGHSFLNAMWIAGFCAFVQIAALGYAVFQRSKSPLPEIATTVALPTSEPSIVPVEMGNPNLSAVPPTIPEASDASLVEPAPAPKVLDPELTKLDRKAPNLELINDDMGEIEDNLLYRMMEGGLADRAKGNYEGAIRILKDVETNLPEHPRVLSELAATYGEMGELEKSSNYWKKVTDLGPIIGGKFHKVAEKVLAGENPLAPEFRPGQILKLGKVREQRFPKNSEGEKVHLSIPIYGDESANPVGSKSNIEVFFFDMINNQTIGSTIAKVDDQFPTQPYDWKDDGLEDVDVIYQLPVLTVEEKRFRGDRVFFGYVIELFYEGVLQDTLVSSEKLRGLRITRPAATETAPRKPLIIPTKPGPESSLFPRPN